jgi:hypothetical protein
MNQFVESMRRLYENKKINEEKVVALFKDGKITMDEKNYILNIE